MKKIINDPTTVVREMCGGIVLAHPELVMDAKFKIIRKKNLNKNKVTLISGGGSGHEPAHAGFVGKGMLDAAVCGDVFASPSQIQIYQAIRQTASDAGTLLIIKNYSGDIMNFRNAAFLAQEDGITVDYVKVDDDIAVQDSLYTVGRRGVAGTVFVHKIVGAAAEAGKTLPEVKAVAEKAAANVKSIGFALTSCTVPAKGTPTFDIGEDEMEYGVGIHGEPGIRREPIATAAELASRMVESLSQELSLKKGERAALLVNGFGGTPLMELYLLNHQVIGELLKKDVTVARTFVGNYMTSIDMAGASISILKLDQELEDLLNAPSDASAFKVNGSVDAVTEMPAINFAAPTAEPNYGVETPADYANVGETLSLENVIYMVDVMCESAIRNEVPFCELDSHAGDGDFGMSIAKGFRQLKAEWKAIVAEQKDIAGFLNACSLVIMENCGGASGPIWGSAFRAAARSAKDKKSLSVSDFATLMQAAVSGIQATGERSFGRGAVVGDKTLIDALVPCADAWTACVEKGATLSDAFSSGAEAAMDGAKSTEKIVARMGRAGTVGERSIGWADAGAYGLAVIFADVKNGLKF